MPRELSPDEFGTLHRGKLIAHVAQEFLAQLHSQTVQQDDIVKIGVLAAIGQAKANGMKLDELLKWVREDWEKLDVKVRSKIIVGPGGENAELELPKGSA